MTDGQTPAWERYRDDEAGFSVDHPDSWMTIEGALGTTVAFRQPDDEDDPGFRANMNVVVVPLDEDPGDSEAFFENQLAALGEAITDPVLVDLENTSLADRPARRVLITHREGAHQLTLEQWYVTLPDRSIVLSATAANEDYAEMAPGFGHMAASFSLDG